ncbi:MAG: hypothetical protein ACRESR_07710 [Gammaproteobacteria bacterium]
MKSLLRIVAVAGLGAIAVCAMAKGGDQSLVSPNQPHAIISTAQPPGPSYYRVKIIWLDGNYLSTPRYRDTFWIAPGKHKIGFRAIMNVNRGPAMLVSPATSQPVNMPTLTLDVKKGYTYYFAAKIPKTGMPNQWKPVVIKTVKPASR